jgi:class 3 adenylate cyclase/tetratricopeptide (TPR) repeat protein
MVFVDISGFTKMSERLARNGKVGAEEVADVIGSVFARLLSVAYGEGGGLIKFGGDALLLLFTGLDHPVRGTRAALGMRQALREIGAIETTAGKVSLRMSVGLHSGVFDFFLVGDSHRELLITGPAATETVSMEGTAVAGEVLASRATAAFLPSAVRGKLKGDGVLLRSMPKGIPRETAPEGASLDGVDLLSCIPVALREHLLAGAMDPEHRQVTVAFIHFDGIDDLIREEGPEAVAFGLDELVRAAQRACEKHGVTFLGTDVDKDGGKIILVAGAPSSPGEDEERMLLAARAVIDAQTAIPIRIGVNKGPVFSGEIGPVYRRTYTVMGDAVNLAARAMAKAEPGQVLATAGVLDASRTRFDLVELEPFYVKGKAKPVHAWSVGPPTGSRARQESLVDLPLVGRDEELGILRTALETARRGRATLVDIVGGPGIGKSRLLRRLHEDAEDFRTLHATCEAYSASTAYAVWRELLRELLGLGWEDPDHVVAERLLVEVDQRTPDLMPWVPLIAIAFDAAMAPTPEVAMIAESNRRAKMHDVVGTFLTSLLSEPTLVLVEDGHHMDEASAELFVYLQRRLERSPLLTAITHRPTEKGFRVPDGLEALRLELDPLTEEAALALAKEATDESPLLPHDLRVVVRRSAGNPQFLLDLVIAAAEGSDLPDSVEAAAVAEIDRLSPVDRTIVRRASIFGIGFHPRFIDAVLEPDMPPPDERTWQRLTDFFEEDGEGYVRFRRGVIREAAYDGLPFRTRRALHLVVGDRLERDFEDPDEIAGVLSVHFLRAGAYEKAYRYSKTAAARARDVYANEEAARLIQRAIEAGRHLPEVGDLELAERYDALSEALRLAGQFQRSATSNAAARRLAKDDPLTMARLLHHRSRLEERVGRYPQALRWATRARRLLETQVTGPEAEVELAQLTARYAQLLQAAGRARSAITWCWRAIDQGKKAHDAKTLCLAYDVLDWATFSVGESNGGRYLRLGLEAAQEAGDLNAQASLLNGLGFTAYYEGRWSEALEFYERAGSLFAAIGDPVSPELISMNIAEILYERGNLDEAESRLRNSLHVYRASGYRYFLAQCLAHLGRLAYRAHRVEEAVTMLDEALTIFTDVGAEDDVVDVLARKAECDLLIGDSDGALALVDEAWARTQASDAGGSSVPLLLRSRGYALAQMGQLDEARAAIDQSLVAARSRRQDLDVALTLQALKRLAAIDGSVPSAEVVSEADAILERLGVEAVVDVPLSRSLA